MHSAPWLIIVYPEGKAMSLRRVILSTIPLMTLYADGAKAIYIADLECRQFRPVLGYLSRQIERPEPPLCATDSIRFSDLSFQTCKSLMTLYRMKVQKFAACLEEEHKRALQEFNDSVEKFNEKASQ